MVDTQTYDVLSCHYFGPEAEHVAASTCPERRAAHPLGSRYAPLPAVDAAGGFAFAHCDETGTSCCVTHGVFSPTIGVLTAIVRPPASTAPGVAPVPAPPPEPTADPVAVAIAASMATAAQLSAFLSGPLPPDSPLLGGGPAGVPPPAGGQRPPATLKRSAIPIVLATAEQQTAVDCRVEQWLAGAPSFDLSCLTRVTLLTR